MSAEAGAAASTPAAAGPISAVPLPLAVAVAFVIGLVVASAGGYMVGSGGAAGGSYASTGGDEIPVTSAAGLESMVDFATVESGDTVIVSDTIADVVSTDYYGETYAVVHFESDPSIDFYAWGDTARTLAGMPSGMPVKCTVHVYSDEGETSYLITGMA